MANKVTNKVNGVNVDQLVDTVNLIKQQPDLAKFTFRVKNKWVSGGHSRTIISGFYGAGQEDTSRNKSFILEGDEPPVLLGENQAPNAVETLLHALASCLAVGCVYNAAAQGINIKSLEYELEGDLDLHGFLGLSEDIRPGYSNIKVNYKIDSDAPKEKLLELCAYVQKTSPVLDIVRNPVDVSINLV